MSQDDGKDTRTALGLVAADRADAIGLYLPDLAPHDRDRVDDYVARASAAATLRAYQSDWRLFCAWCAESGYRSLPATPAIVAAFLTLLAERGFVPQVPQQSRGGRAAVARPLGRSTIGRRLAAIVFAHRAAGIDPPTHQPDAARADFTCGASNKTRG